MNPIPTDLISAIPDSIEAEREECQDAADAALMVLFSMAGELETVPDLPPIISNGREVYPLPAPWLYEPPLRLGTQKIDTDELLDYINGAPATEFRGAQPGLLKHIKKTAEAYNQALALNDRPTAEKCAVQSVPDSATVWSTCNALAESVETGGNYSAFLISTETKKVYYQAQL